MRAPEKQHCPHCRGKIPGKIILSWGQSCLSRKRRRLRAPDGKKADALPGQESTPPKTPKCDGDPICPPPFKQLPDSGMADFAMTENEVTNFALSVFAGVLSGTLIFTELSLATVNSRFRSRSSKELLQPWWPSGRPVPGKVKTNLQANS
jgi:hypothetical protein